MPLFMRCVALMLVLALAVAGPASSLAANRSKSCRDEYHAQNIPKSQTRQFMKECLKRTAPGAADTAEKAIVDKTEKSIINKSRNAACRAQATALKLHGEARKIFVGTCLDD